MSLLSIRQEPRKGRPVMPYRSLLPLRGDMEDFFSRFWGNESEGALMQGLTASMDVSETDKTVDVRLDLPGVEAKDFDIQIDNGVLTISGERKEEEVEEDKKRHYYHVERRYGSFARSVTLPCSVCEDEVVAQYKDGVLTITLPKAEEGQARKIKVKG